MDSFGRLLDSFPFSETTKADHAKVFLWYLIRDRDSQAVPISDVRDLFEAASLHKPPITRLRGYFVKDRECHQGARGTYRLTRDAAARYDEEYGSVFAPPDSNPEIIVQARLEDSPGLSETDVEQAKSMAQLYVVLNCFENSARSLVESTLSRELGDAWWDEAANTGMKRKVESRKEKEQRDRWITPRGNSELYYLDFGELLTLIRKYESAFARSVGNIEFVQLRFSEMERLRNIVAHNGYLDPEGDEFKTAILHFREWCRQVRV